MGIQTDNGFEYVHPTFFYESIADFAIFLILRRLLNNRKYEGQIMSWYFTLYSFIRFWIEGLRVDSLMLGNIRISQVVSLILFIISIYYVSKLKKKQK